MSRDPKFLQEYELALSLKKEMDHNTTVHEYVFTKVSNISWIESFEKKTPILEFCNCLLTYLNTYFLFHEHFEMKTTVSPSTNKTWFPMWTSFIHNLQTRFSPTKQIVKPKKCKLDPLKTRLSSTKQRFWRNLFYHTYLKIE